MTKQLVMLTTAQVIIVFLCDYAHAQISFKVYEMGNWGNKMGQTSLVDIDNDGDLDFVSGTRGGELSWWEYRAADRWLRHALGKGHKTDVGGIALDVDGDRRIDQVSGNCWYQNRGQMGQVVFNRFETGVIKCHDMRTGDLDGDGQLDIVALTDNVLRWYKIPIDPTKKWIGRDLGSGIHAGLAVADIDGDGDNDVVRAQVWYENKKGNGTAWITHANIPFQPNPKDGTITAVGDFDNDGDLDLALVDHDGRDISWIENRDGKGGKWREHPLWNGLRKSHSCLAADFDIDGDLDIYAGDTVGNAYVWENTDGKGNFRQLRIAANVIGHETRAADVDGDGDIDMCSKPWNGGRHVYFRNMLKENVK